jgi:hypothetical protein
MNKKEVGQLLTNVSSAYPNFSKDSDKELLFDFWYRCLKEFDYEQVLENLINYVKTNEFPPKIKDLVNGLVVNEKYNVPGIEETQKIMDSYQVPKEQRVPQDELKKMFKRQFGKDRGKEDD